jgi:chitin disaccharide deacetylase
VTAGGPGLLIVNADDWGYDSRTTDAIADCFEAGGLTSTTAMVFMADSERAAERSRRLPGLGVGLHLNLVEEFSDPATPPAVRDRQRRFVDHFRKRRLRRWTYDLRIRHEANRIVADQFRRFHELYGRAPTHLDGHHHCHLAANVLLSPAVPRGTKIRNALSDGRRDGPVADGVRAVRDRLLARRFATTDYFLSVRSVWPPLGAGGDPGRLDLALEASVEVMVHPAFPDEYPELISDRWRATLARLRLGSFADL